MPTEQSFAMGQDSMMFEEEEEEEDLGAIVEEDENGSEGSNPQDDVGEVR
jgi:hypothetical protein